MSIFTGRLIAGLIVFFLGLNGIAAAGQVVDAVGRRVQVPERPRRIIALAPNLTEIVYDLGQGDKLVGATTFSEHPPAARQLPRVGSYVRLDLERIVALRPDLCLASRDGNPRPAVEKIEAMGIPVYVVDPQNLEQIAATVTRLGALLGAADVASAMVNDMQVRVARVEARLAATRKRPRVFFQIDDSPMVSVGTNTFIHELISRAGGDNVAAGPVPYPRFSWEDILGLQPEIVVITSMAGGRTAGELEAAWRKWPQVPAVAADRLHVVDADLFDRATPRLVEGLERLAVIFHPDIFSDHAASQIKLPPSGLD